MMNNYRILVSLMLFVVLPLTFPIGLVAVYASDPQIDQLIKEELVREDAGDLQGAIEVNKKILSFDPKDVRAMNAIAGLYGKLGKFEEEIAWAKKAMATDETFYLAYINYGNAQTYLQRVQEAREAFEKARRLAPRDPLPVYSLGLLAEDQHKLSEATSFYEESVALDPKFENGYFSLAAMYANAKRFDEAVAALRKVLELNPQSTDAKAMLRQIEKERKR